MRAEEGDTGEVAGGVVKGERVDGLTEMVF